MGLLRRLKKLEANTNKDQMPLVAWNILSDLYQDKDHTNYSAEDLDIIESNRPVLKVYWAEDNSRFGGIENQSIRNMIKHDEIMNGEDNILWVAKSDDGGYEDLQGNTYSDKELEELEKVKIVTKLLWESDYIANDRL